jgi:hypothetical protein
MARSQSLSSDKNSPTMESDIFIRGKGRFCTWRLEQTFHADLRIMGGHGGRGHLLFRTDVGTFLGHRTLHQQHGE